MAKNTSMSLGDRFEGFVNRQIESGRHGSASNITVTALWKRAMELERDHGLPSQ